MHQPSDLRAVADAVVHEAGLINSAGGAALLLQQGDHLRTVAASEPSVWQISDIEARCHEGPGLSPHWVGDVCRIRTMAAETRWPTWALHVAALGWHSMVSVRLTTSVRSPALYDTPPVVLGVLNLYYQTTASLAGQLETASTFATHASVAVSHALCRARLRQAVDLLGKAPAVHTAGVGRGVEPVT